MLSHLKGRVNNIKGRGKFYLLVYFLVWAISIAIFWLGGKSDAMGYSLLVFFLVLPVTSLILSIFIGQDEKWTKSKWLMPIFFGVMHMLGVYLTFSMANMVAFEKINLPKVEDMVAGILSSALGLFIGRIIARGRKN